MMKKKKNRIINRISGKMRVLFLIHLISMKTDQGLRAEKVKMLNRFIGKWRKRKNSLKDIYKLLLILMIRLERVLGVDK